MLACTYDPQYKRMTELQDLNPISEPRKWKMMIPNKNMNMPKKYSANGNEVAPRENGSKLGAIEE